MTSTLHLVVPGQVIASTASSADEESFLRGHGTYLERIENPQTSQQEQRLVASVVGMVHRVNKLITVIPSASSLYWGQVGDLVVGRIVAVGPTRWRVQLVGNGRDAQLPLTGIHLPGGVQRIRTAQDQRDMRHFFVEGDLVSAEVHKVQQDGSLVLHTRSTRYGKLENGVLVQVPPALIQRRKNHYLTDFGGATVDNSGTSNDGTSNTDSGTMDVVWGANGSIWIQRRLNRAIVTTTETSASATDSALNSNDMHEQLRQEHADSPYMKEDRMTLARLRNSIECLRLIHAMVTPEAVLEVYHQSMAINVRPAAMLNPTTVLQLTASTRNH